MKPIISIVIAILTMVGDCRSDTVTYSAALSDGATDWTNTVALPKFNPSGFGTLTAAEIKLVSTNRMQSRIENLGGQVSSALSSIESTVTASGPIGAPITLVSSSQWTNSLARYDRKLDFGGTSGVTNPEALKVEAATQAVTDLEAVTGDGTIPIGIGASGRSHMSGVASVSCSFSTSAAAVVSITYTYTPIP